MNRNMGTVDRVVRILIAIGVAALYYSGRIGGWLAILLGLVAVVFLVTGFAGRCPGYIPFKFSTRRKSSS